MAMPSYEEYQQQWQQQQETNKANVEKLNAELKRQGATMQYVADPMKPGQYLQVQVPTKAIDETDPLLSTEDAIKLNVPFGTRRSEAAGIIPMDAAERKKNIQSDKALEALDQIQGYSEKVNTAPTSLTGSISRLIGGGLKFLGAKSQMDPDAANFDIQQGKLGAIIKALGDTGTLSDQDFKRASRLIPAFYDTKEVAQKKIQDLRDLLSDSEDETAQKPVQDDPLGIF